MNYLFDAAIGVILILCVIAGARKGLLNTLVSVGVHILCIIVAVFLTFVLGENIYYDYVQYSVTENIESSLESFSMSDELKSYFREETVGFDLTDSQVNSILSDTENMDKKLASSVNYSDSSYTEKDGQEGLFSILDVQLQEKITRYMPPCGNRFFDDIRNSEKEMYTLISLIDTDRHGAAVYIEEHCVRSVMMRFVRIVCAVIFSLVLMVIAKTIMAVIESRKGAVKAAGAADAVLGAAAGILVAVTLSLVAAMICKMIIYAGGNVSFFNDEALNSTFVFRYFYNIDKLFIK